MRIDSLFMEGFGRFVGHRIELGPGLNLIYGPNEAGKSTLQHFLIGMLYGQKRRGARREASPDQNRYRPWSGLPYRGMLSYQLQDGRSFRVERSFEPDRAQIWEAVTGQELTATFAMDRRKELLFAEAHLGLGEDGFRSTAWVGQGAIHQMTGGAELASRIANLQESGQEELSVRAAQDWLAVQAKQIGSDRAPTRPLARTTKQLQELAEQLARAERVIGEVRGWEAEEAEIAAILEGLAEEERSLEHRLAVAKLERLTSLHNQVERSEASLALHGPYADFPVDLSAEIEPLVTELRWAETEAAERGGLAQRSQGEADRLAAQLGTLRHLPAERLQRLGSLPALLAERDRVRRELAAMRSLIPDQPAEREAGKGPNPLTLLLGLLILVGAFVMGMERPLLGAAIAVVGLGALWLYQRQRPAAKAPTASKIERIEREALQAQVASLEAQIGELAGDLGPAFLAGPDPAAAVQELLGRQHAWTAAEAEAKAAALRAAEAQGALAKLRAELEALLAEAGVSEVVAFQQGVERARSYQEAKRALAALAPLLAGRSAVDLAEELALLRAQVGGHPEPLDQEPIKVTTDSPEVMESALRQLRQRQGDRLARLERLRGQIETAKSNIPDMAELLRQQAELTERLEGYEEELAAIGLAQQVLGDVAEEMHREFAPRLARAMGRLVEQLTGGRYNQVRVDESLDLRTIGPAERIVSVGALSAGTIDQFYLGLRIALLDMVAAEGEPIPLLLDDPFVSYDDTRLLQALTLLGDWAKERQILLLTCQERELRAVEALGLTANLIRLDRSSAEVDLAL